MDKFERRLDATLKIVQTGMKLLVKVQQETRAMQQENREFREETRRAISALIEAQMRTDAKLDRLVAALLRSGSNGDRR